MSNEDTAGDSRQTHVTKERDDLEYTSNDLIDVVTSLEEKLKNVLTPEPPSPDEDSSKKEQELVPLAYSLKISKEKIQSQLGRLRSIYNRLEN